MPARSPRRHAALLLLLALVAASCGGGPGRGRSIESLELIDFTVAGMFKQTSIQLGRPYVLEVTGKFGVHADQQDLRLENTDERAVLEELCRLDPTFQFRMDTPAWMLFPSGESGLTSPYATRIETFRADGGAFAVMKQLLGQALPKDTRLSMPSQGRARPVVVDLEDATVREVLAEVAAQAQLGFNLEPGFVRGFAVPESR